MALGRHAGRTGTEIEPPGRRESAARSQTLVEEQAWRMQNKRALRAGL